MSDTPFTLLPAFGSKPGEHWFSDAFNWDYKQVCISIVAIYASRHRSRFTVSSTGFLSKCSLANRSTHGWKRSAKEKQAVSIPRIKNC